jgi:hypothetical protein
MNPLNTIQGTIATGVVFAVAIGLLTFGVQLNEISLMVWLHVGAGVVWIGMLYYFNFVQVPALAAAAKDQGGPAAPGSASTWRRVRCFGFGGAPSSRG